MRVLMINSVCGIRSTGRICTDLADELTAQGHEVRIAYGREYVPKQYQKYAVKIGSDLEVKLHALNARLFDRAGFGSERATKAFVRWIEKFDPDIIHLHNIHGYYINIKILFDYLKRCGKTIFWSLYDCWSFTGHCAHFDFNHCEQWKTECENCRFKGDYPRCIGVSRSSDNYRKKRQIFCDVPHLRLIAPSMWMNSTLSESFLSGYPCCVLPNGIDIDRYFQTDSTFREDNNLQDKSIVLGVSVFWTKEKGLEYFVKLAKDLPSEKYQIVIVGGVDSSVLLPDSILHIDRTDSIKTLCEIYSSVDVFVNPTLQETQGLTTVEALACGTPAVVFNSGGAAECITETCGIVVDKSNYKALLTAVRRIIEHKTEYLSQNCRNQALKFNKSIYNKRLIGLYEDAIKKVS